MAITAKLLAEGQLAVASTTVYTVPAATQGIPRLIWIHNDNATTESVYVTFRPTSTDRDAIRIDLATEESAEIEIPAGFPAGAIIKMRGTSASGVNFMIFGAEVT